MVGGVPPRRLEAHLVVEGEVVLHHLGEARLHDGDHAVRDLVLRGLLVHGRPVRPLLLGHDVAGVGEGRDPAAPLPAGVPPHVVGVEVGGEHVVDLLGPHPGLGEAQEILAARGHVPVGPRALLVVAHAGVDHDGVVPRAEEERLHREDQAVHRRVQGPAGQPRPVGRPLLGGDLREELGGVEVRALRLDDPVDDDVADLLLQHGGASLGRAIGAGQSFEKSISSARVQSRLPPAPTLARTSFRNSQPAGVTRK